MTPELWNKIKGLKDYLGLDEKSMNDSRSAIVILALNPEAPERKDSVGLAIIMAGSHKGTVKMISIAMDDQEELGHAIRCACEGTHDDYDGEKDEPKPKKGESLHDFIQRSTKDMSPMTKFMAELIGKDIESAGSKKEQLMKAMKWMAKLS
jgi:hypothetical protein